MVFSHIDVILYNTLIFFIDKVLFKDQNVSNNYTHNASQLFFQLLSNNTHLTFLYFTSYQLLRNKRNRVLVVEISGQ